MLIGRETEQQILIEILNSNKPEFLAIYGRRRIGKTFLVRELFKNKNCIFLNTTGSQNGALSEQISHFTDEVSKVFYHGVAIEKCKNWDKTFKLLTEAIDTIPKKKKIVLFFDEFPWMATPKSRLLQNLDYYWNQHWSRNNNVKLIICGSSASWIINKIINNKGGLHNRITKKIQLEPFSLKDTKRFLNAKGFKLTNKQLLHIYMVMGGVPYYLNNVSKGLSASQLIDHLAFQKNGLLFEEFENLFSSLFKEHEILVEIIRVIAEYRYGISQEELFKKIDKGLKGKRGIAKLKELENAGFILNFKPHFHEKRGIYYKLIDEYTLFYLQWIEPIKDTLLKKSLSEGYWDKVQNSVVWYSWTGLAFESICYKHLYQIGKALKLGPTAVPNAWRYVPVKKSIESGAQIDLLFDRDDDAITICEIKCTDLPFSIDKSYAAKLNQKLNIFKKITKTNKQLFIAMISANGLKKTIYSEDMVDGVVTLDELFS